MNIETLRVRSLILDFSHDGEKNVHAWLVNPTFHFQISINKHLLMLVLMVCYLYSMMRIRGI